MNELVYGGYSQYGLLAGILMSDSIIPRIPGDPGHAETLSFPVCYETLHGFPFEDLIHGRSENLDKVINPALSLQDKGVKFIAADCGLFSPLQKEISKHLDVPFIGSPLDMIPMLDRFLPDNKQVGVITGDTRILKDIHLSDYGCSGRDLIISGMDNSDEFEKVVINHGKVLDVSNMRREVIEAANQLALSRDRLGVVILECTNLCTFRKDIQQLLKVPVFDIVSLLEFFAGGYLLLEFKSKYI